MTLDVLRNVSLFDVDDVTMFGPVRDMTVTITAALPKHRYVYLLGNKTERREARALLRYPVLPYPKATADRKD